MTEVSIMPMPQVVRRWQLPVKVSAPKAAELQRIQFSFWKQEAVLAINVANLHFRFESLELWISTAHPGLIPT